MQSEVVKVFPIKDRTDFFKYVVMYNGEITKDFDGKEMYFDSFFLAENVCKAQNNVRKIDKDWKR